MRQIAILVELRNTTDYIPYRTRVDHCVFKVYYLVVWLSVGNSLFGFFESRLTELVSSTTKEYIQSLGVVRLASAITEVDESFLEVECPKEHLTVFKQITKLFLVELYILGSFLKLLVVLGLFKV